MKHFIDEKNIDSAIRFITEVEYHYSFVLKGGHTPFHRFLGKMQKYAESCYKVEIQKTPREFPKLKDISSVILETSRGEFRVNQILINSIDETTIKGEINEFSVNNINEAAKKYYRLIIKRTKNLSFSYFFDYCYPFQKGSFKSREQLKVKIGTCTFNIYLYPIKGVQYLIIDSGEEISFDSFNRSVYSIVLVYGFITGNFPMDEGYYFAYSDKGHNNNDYIKYSRFIDSIETIYHPIYTNAYGYTDDPKKAKLLNKSLKGISEEVFSKLCTKVYTSQDFAAALYIFLEGSNGSIQMMPGSYSMCLETLTGIIAAENEGKLSPIKSKTIAKKIRKDLVSVLENYKTDIDPVYDVLKNRINNFNSPTNRDKLVKPFEILKIKLTSDDLECIDRRNDFLHGRRPTVEKGNDFNLILHTALKLVVLNSALILKYCGFSGKILNHPQIQSLITKIDLHEDIYRDI